MELTEALRLAEQQRDILLAERDMLGKQLADLAVEIEGLRRAVQRHGGVRPSPIENLHRIQDLPRTDAIIEVLRVAAAPLSPAEVVDVLTAVGRADEYNAVSAAIAHLARTDRVHSVGRGQWVIGPPTSEESDAESMPELHDSHPEDNATSESVS